MALVAWKYPDAGGFRPLPTLNIACSGQGVIGKKEEWLALANGNDRLREGMDRLYNLFRQAPVLGSLIDPRQEKGNLFEAGHSELLSLLTTALAKHTGDEDLAALGIVAQGITKAAELLDSCYTLVATNVPYLGRGKQSEPMRKYLDDHHTDGKADIATAFVLRCLDLCVQSGTVALVSPQSWLFQTTYTALRQSLLKCRTWEMVAKLGPKGFQTPMWDFNIQLGIISAPAPTAAHSFYGLDATIAESALDKALLLRDAKPFVGQQCEQIANPDCRIVFGGMSEFSSIKSVAGSGTGMQTFDSPRFVFSFWELREPNCGWIVGQTTVNATRMYAGCSTVVRWEDGQGQLYSLMELKRLEGYTSGIWRAGTQFWGKQGVLVSLMSSLPCALYLGGPFDNNTAAIIPHDENDLLSLWAFCSSPEFFHEVRKIDQALKVTTNTLEKIPFDKERWTAVATHEFPNGIGPRAVTDVSEWLFGGDIPASTDPLQVAVARLLGYRWPKQPITADAIDKLVDSDGILCLPGVRGEAAASERLLEVLHAAYSKNWSDSVLHKLLSDVGCKSGSTLEDWLRNQFFEQHCKQFNNRPFIWHIWDGRKDGFSALVNYHKLTHKALENLAYSYLGDWITAQSKSDKVGADSRLGAAQELQAKLKLILAGEPPYDIFLRWKPLQEQSIGWHPDLNDGVRMNIRPFIEAEVLRKNPNIKWTKDRGKEPEREKADFPWFWNGKEFVGDRINDIHLTNAEKTAARDGKKGAK